MKKLKINNLISRQIETKAMKMLVGGEETGCTSCCLCGCLYEESNSSNGNANMSAGKYSPGGGTHYGSC